MRPLIHQPSYSLLNRWIEGGLLDILEQEGMGCITFSPRAQGLLTNKYLGGIPDDSRIAKGGALSQGMLTDANLEHVRALDALAQRRGQSLPQLALAWTLRDPRVTSTLIGASRVGQVEEAVGALAGPAFTDSELAEIDRYAVEGGINLWKQSSDS